MQKKSFGGKVKQHFILFLAKEINPPPILFFTLYLYCHLKIQSPSYMAYSFFSVGLLYAILFSYNHFYIYSPILNRGIGYLSILNLALGLLAANEKWKLYLYLFVIGDSITIEYPILSKVYTICCCLYLCTEIYNYLIFKNFEDNVRYFTGFSTIFVFELFRKLIESTDGYSGIPYFTVPFSVLIAYKLIKDRIQNLKKQSLPNLRNIELIYHYISLVQEQIKSPYARQGFIQTHKDNCSKTNCFCRNNHFSTTNFDFMLKTQFQTKVQYFYIRFLYESALSLKRIPKKDFLQIKFIDFLIDNNQITEAIQMHIKLQALSAKFYYFRWVQRVRIQNKIRAKLQQYDYFNIFSKQFEYVFKYDLSYLYLASQIKEILKKKVQFWKQCGNQTPMMISLQNLGSEIVQKMFELNNFYYKDIKKQQQKINNFNGTIMYAMYLLSTTNYKEFAESLIKNTSRTLESIKIHEDNIAETYGMKVSIRDTNKTSNEKVQILPQIINSTDFEEFMLDEPEMQFNLSSEKEYRDRAEKFTRFYSNGFLQVISNVSGSLCKLLKTSKNQIVGKDLSIIIPKLYQEKHHFKVKKILHYGNQSEKDLANLSFINKIREVPLKTTDNKLITAKMSVKIYEDIDQGLSFVALIQTINENKITFITNIDGVLQEYEEGLGNMRIFESQQFSDMLKNLKEQWNTQNILRTKKINIAYMENNYSVTFSSPYQQSFLDHNYVCSQQQLYQSEDEVQRLFPKKSQISSMALAPPIHIDITNESEPYLMNPRQDRQQQMSKCIKKMQSVFYKTDIDSQSSTNSSRKSSVVNVLMTFSQNYFIPFYGYIMAVFALIMIGSIIANSIAYTSLGLAWDNNSQTKNPILNLISIMDIREYMICAINQQEDLRQYNANQLLNKTNIHNFFGLSKTTYPTYVKQFISRISSKYKYSVNSISMYISDVFKESINQVWKILIPTVNPNNPDLQKKTQNLPLQNILMNYLVDLDLLSLGKEYSSTIISLTFWSTIEFMLSNLDPLNILLKQSIDKSILLNYLYCGILALLILLTMIPFYVVLKKRVKRHIDIYDLIVSVEGQLIVQQVKKLDNIVTIVNNSNKSSEVLKTNTINYLARKRSSAINDNTGDGSNQMIEGLIQPKIDSISQHEGESVVSELLQTKNFDLLKKLQKENLHSKIKQNDEIVAEQTKKLRFRRRSGELDFRGSEGDSKKIVWKHWTLYLIIILSTVTLFLLTVPKTAYFSSLKQNALKIQWQYKNFADDNLVMLNAKYFYRGMEQEDFDYRGMKWLKWLQENIYANQAIKFVSSFNQSAVLPSCTSPGQIQYKFCQNNYSLLTLRQQVNHYVKQAYEHRLNLNKKYSITNQNITSVPKEELKSMSEYFFYVQSKRDKIFNISQEYKEKLIFEIFEGQEELNSMSQVIIVAGSIFEVVSLFLGLILINYMKKLYFKEIIIVSFLNNEMISKNKRVESFLETLSKSSY